MRSFFVAALAALAAAQDTTTSSSTDPTSSSSASASIVSTSTDSALSTSSASPSSSSVTPSSVTPSSSVAASSSVATSSSVAASKVNSASGSVVTVAQDGSSQFTAINAAVSFAQVSGFPTVSVLPGTYSETIAIQGTQTVTIAGPSASNYAANQVVVAAAPTGTAGVVSFNTQQSTGVTFKNINITNTLSPAGGKAPAVTMYGKNMAFYNCALISTGTGVYTASFGTTLISGSYIEGSDKLFYNYITLYVYKSTIVPTGGSANIFFGQGYQTAGVWYNSSIVVDSSSIQQKAGLTNSYVYLASPNGNYTAAIFRGSNLGSLIAPTGVRATVCNYVAVYGEYANTGAGAMTSSNSASRVAACDHSLTASQISGYTIDQLFGHGFSGYSSYDTTWIDSSVLQSIQSSDASQVGSVSSSSVASSSTVSSSSAITSSVSSASATSSSDGSLSQVLSSTASASSGSATDSASLSPSSTGSSTDAGSSTLSASTSSAQLTTSASASAAAVTVGPTSAQFSDIGAAVTFAQNSAIPSVVVLAGTYSAFTIAGTQTVTVSGPSATAVSDNQVVVSSSGTTGSLAIGSSGAKGATFRNLNFTNTATTGAGPAVAMRGLNMAFYGCALVSSAVNVYTASYGITLLANSYVEGTDKLFANYPTVYAFNTAIVPTGSSASILYSKGALIGGVNYNATLVLDSGSVSAKAGSAASNVYLATPNGAFGYLTAIFRGSSLGSLVSAGGVYSSSCSVVANFGEFGTTGAGCYSNNAASRGSASCDYQLSASQVSAYTIDQVFGNAFSPYSNKDTTWIDADVLSAIQSADASQLASASSAVPSSTSTSASASASGSASVTCPTPTPSATLVVSQNATACQYPNVTAAIAALPNDSKPYTISIMAGTYTEQFSITRNGKVTLIGETTFANDYTQNKVRIQINNGVLTSAGQDEITPVINAKKTNDNSGLAVYNIDFVNTYPQTKNVAALAADFYGANIAAYGCSFVGFQDTLLANKGTQVFSNSYIEGSIDFIWGFSTAYFHQCYIASNTPGACISAQSRTAGTISGYVFDSCYVTYTSTYGSSFGLSYLGRPYNNFSTAIYMNSYIDKHINAAGWQVWQTNNPQTSDVTFAEFNNTGPGSWQAGTARASFATNITATQASQYTLGSWIGDSSWIDMTAYNYAPSFNWTTTSAPASGTTTGPSGSTSTSTVNAHPDSGTEPPQYAVLVSPNGAVNGSYSNVTAALASLPSDNTNQTVFIYAGSYNEQLPSINRPGAVRFIGYTQGSPGKNYTDNQVTISFARGLSVSPLPAGHSDAETATVQTASNRISFYNINIINTDNLDGSEASYVTLAASIYGNDIGFYACSFNGWQDTLLNGATAGYQYYESCYIGGAIDFIWGYSKAYFKGCTIGAKRASSAITAQSRASASAIGGYIFDQCLFTAAPDATVDLTNKVYLGRPYSAYALVVIKNSYIDKIINPSGWKIWSAADPRTDHITFAEYNNVGPSNWENNVAARQAFGNATLLTSDTYSLASVMDSTSWIDQTYSGGIVTPQPSVVTAPSGGNITVGGSSAYNGTVPPTGALIVSKQPIAGQTVYGSIQDALNAAPTSSKTNATIFIYPGTYEEKIIVNKSGSTIFMGYSDATDDYSSNQVTIQQSYGEDTQGDGSDVDAATVYATGNYFYAYNVNFRNNNGTQQNIASLGFAVKSSKYAFMHGCQIYGNQDTLYISGSMFTFKTYIEGNIDFIFGAGAGYFLNSTIAPNEDGDSITAQKRTTNTTKAGFVFDQCSIAPATGVNAAGWNNVSLGRPWNNFANVAYINSYLFSGVGAAGWDQWSKSAPQTDGVSYGEYHNYGPGASTCGRASFSSQLSDAQVVQYQLSNFFLTTSWIDFSVVDVQPFVPGIGSAPPGCVTSSTVSLPTPSSTVLSLTASSTSLLSTSTASLVTVYTTKTFTDKEIASTTVSNGASTSTSTLVVTENDGTTVTPSPILKTSVVKATSFVTSTLTQAPSTVTIRSTETDFQTVSAAGKATTIKSTQTVLATSTVSGKAATIVSTVTVLATSSYTPKPKVVSATTTVFIVSTVTPKPVTITDNQGGLSTVYSTITPKAASTTSILSISGANVVKTTSLKGSTSVVSITSFKTTTKKTTVTCSPTPAARLRRALFGRAAGTTTITVNTTLTAFPKTSTISLAGSTFYETATRTSSIFPASTLKAATSTVLSTSFATASSIVTESASAATVSSIVTKSSVVTEAQPASTITSIAYVTAYVTVSQGGSTVSSLKTVSSVVTETQPQTISTAYKVITSTSVQTAAQQTVTFVNSADSTVRSTTTLPASTSTIFKTVTAKGSTVTSTVSGAVATKTTTVKANVTVYSTATKSSSGAPACTA
ncbi:hypothetical protein LTR56_011980 [Elasticomyces elasticus]|nr:hypothetical protein LTR22_018079 [Elasticomyces elasticus]KAK3640184.1 hypothetical protein LTR56_011980 [Elasticomyces elasticus]KAK4913299.1 hypothetical protein LTR49_018372 [Elasticomyces elasticus]KAK5749021.1 hypothetical protein LTS12_020919 [Elasticomyces elasticus]